MADEPNHPGHGPSPEQQRRARLLHRWFELAWQLMGHHLSRRTWALLDSSLRMEQLGPPHAQRGREGIAQLVRATEQGLVSHFARMTHAQLRDPRMRDLARELESVSQELEELE